MVKKDEGFKEKVFDLEKQEKQVKINPKGDPETPNFNQNHSNIKCFMCLGVGHIAS